MQELAVAAVSTPLVEVKVLNEDKAEYDRFIWTCFEAVYGTSMATAVWRDAINL